MFYLLVHHRLHQTFKCKNEKVATCSKRSLKGTATHKSELIFLPQCWMCIKPQTKLNSLKFYVTKIRPMTELDCSADKLQHQQGSMQQNNGVFYMYNVM